MSGPPPDSEATQALIATLPTTKDGFDSLFKRYRQTLKLAVGLRLDKRTRARFDESDVVQETYTEAYRRMDDFLERRPMPFHLWIRKTALEQVIKLKRKHVHASRRTVDKEAGLTQDSTFRLAREFAASSMTASTLFDEKQRAEVVRRAIVKLSVSDQEILLMRHYESLSYEEIAYILGIETATVRKRNGRALIRLHRFLRELGITESQA